jgi:alanyl-tRNA synthetase
VKTERLYYSDSYLTSFRATLVDQRDEGCRVYLDQTAFYPTSGGQLFDTGRLGGVRVIEVVDEDEQIAHLLEAPLPPGVVEGVVDWRRRFDHMQQHTGQHLLSAVFANEFGCQTVSVHFGDATATLDLDVGALGPAEIRRAESRANTLVTENLSVQVAFEDAAAATGLRKATERSGPIRIVTIAGLDRSACGGTHVRATGEIGPILIRKVERVKKLVRLEFLCGARAVARARADFEILSELAGPASAGIDDLPALLEKQRAELKGIESVRRVLEAELHIYRARELYQAARPDESGRRCILHQAAGGTMESCRGLAQHGADRNTHRPARSPSSRLARQRNRCRTPAPVGCVRPRGSGRGDRTAGARHRPRRGRDRSGARKTHQRRARQSLTHRREMRPS